jgi:hypothetical protein
MTRFAYRAAAVAFLTAGPVAVGADERPEKPAAKAAPTAAPDWSNFAKAAEVSGEVTKVSENGFTLRVTWYTTGGTGGSRGSGGGTSAYNSLMNGRTPTRRSGGGGGKPKEQHEDYELVFAEGGMVRWKRVKDVPGAVKNGFVSPADETKLLLPHGTPGFAAEKSHLKEWHVVEVTLVLPRDVPQAKATPSDLRVKYAIIHGEDKTPNAPDKDDKKK